MIFYFSATGNSLWVARELARAFGGGAPVGVAEALKEGRTTYRLAGAERVFLVFPVHSWGLPTPVARFIERLREIGGGTVAAYLRNEGYDAVVWGILEETAHQPGEYSVIANLMQESCVLAVLAADCSGA